MIPRAIGDADVLLVNKSRNFRNNKSNRYLALDEAIQRGGGPTAAVRRKDLKLACFKCVTG